ncbi:hypothetical protein BDV96DRAFT_571182 [Lophiotrema nucula]|uniref:Uncharacterized protein n=1 Tax=Lophiotrema nucula TaxID=690887 RepID=A0A6A5ZEP9_9PLEO|nr:hypothetical protein BDV96DRAFT_571182 [Lophiotrema nucula]
MGALRNRRRVGIFLLAISLMVGVWAGIEYDLMEETSYVLLGWLTRKMYGLV